MEAATPGVARELCLGASMTHVVIAGKKKGRGEVITAERTDKLSLEMLHVVGHHG